MTVRLRFRSLLSPRHAALLLIATSLVGAGGLVTSACSDDSETNTTPGFRVVLKTRAELAGGATFTNAFDWQFTLTKVAISTGALYYFDGEPIESTAALAPKPDGFQPWQLLSPRVAHAHPGHYVPGEAKGEMLTPASFDLIPGAVGLADGEGTSGVFRSAKVNWQSPAEGALAAELGDHVILLEGSATKGALSKVFRFVATRADALDAADEPALEGCAFDEADVQGDGTVVLRVDPSVWLDQAELDELPDSPDGEPVSPSADDPAARAFVRGIKKSSALTFHFEPS